MDSRKLRHDSEYESTELCSRSDVDSENLIFESVRLEDCDSYTKRIGRRIKTLLWNLGTRPELHHNSEYY
ncbi:229_t:CDS:2 [Rhizophagus irregularis]|nr:229_t:CDS:2 [Rhizophagus irregularis]